MTSNIDETKKKGPILNPDFKVGGKNKPNVKNPAATKKVVDDLTAKLLAQGKKDGKGKDEYTEEDILNLFKEMPNWADEDLAMVKNAIKQLPKQDSDQDTSDQDASIAAGGLSDTQLEYVKRMKQVMNNMTMKQVEFLRKELLKGNDEST